MLTVIKESERYQNKSRCLTQHRMIPNDDDLKYRLLYINSMISNLSTSLKYHMAYEREFHKRPMCGMELNSSE